MFILVANFRDFLGHEDTIMEKTDNWEQVFGAFIIQVGDPDCIHCEVIHKDNQGYPKLDLIYNTHKE